MPAVKKRPSRGAQKRDFWGDETEGQRFEKMLNKKFGSHFGSRKEAIEALGLGRRLLNMYITGERAIPERVWKHIKLLPDFDPRTAPATVKKAMRRKPPSSKAYSDFVKQHNRELASGRRVATPVGRRAIPALLFIDDIDPLS